MKTKTITSLSKTYNTDKKMNDNTKATNGLFGHDYATLYDKHLTNLLVYNMLEIGISFGGSIRMWLEYFGSQTTIYAMDITDERFKNENLENDNRLKIFLGDQGSVSFLNETFHNINFDFIVDDGSHQVKHQLISLKTLFHKLNPGGLYVIEDLHTSLSGNFHNPDEGMSTLEILYQLQNNEPINSKYLNKKEISYLRRNIYSIKIYKNKINTQTTYIIAFITKS